MRKNILISWVVLGLLILLPCLASQGMAEGIELRLSDPMVSIVGKKLSVSFGVEVDGQTQLRAMLRDGAIIALEAECILSRKRSMWLNDSVSTEIYSSILSYDQLTREFLLHMPDESNPKRDRKLSRLLSDNWHDITISLNSLPLAAQPPNSSYRMDLKVSLRHRENPPWLEKTLLFVPDVVAGTESKRLDFEF